MCGRGHSGVSRSKPACPKAVIEGKEKAVVVDRVLVYRGVRLLSSVSVRCQ